MQNDVREVLEGAWLEIHHEGYPPENERDTCRLCDRFRRFLDAEAYLDAAMMLVPEGWGYQIMPLFCVLRHSHLRELDVEAHGNHPAIALATAALKAKEQP